ncbi:hypothetical protein [Desulfosporosinus shakirovi]|uniref:hypothetical protein n=1 Tax=Desulfosporosinus shakirovi TaxID=2885154 RepID=UPI001E29F649|nr:hypothetical protein [Desulfosporosinus sp. SRJS8]MCB8814697.1 hypothetical protein [Desulfosporosinus sp. SRJS8]
MKKLLFACLAVGMCLLGMTNGAFAAENTDNKFVPTGIYLRECVGYEPNYTTTDWTNKSLGQVSGDNRDGHSPLRLIYEYETTGEISAAISGHANGSTEEGVIFAKVAAEVGVEVTGTRKWYKGRSAGSSYDVPPGRFEVLKVYIPAIKTAGVLKYKVYMDGYPNDFFYEYETLKGSYAPIKSGVHYKVASVINKASELPAGIKVYTPKGSYRTLLEER